MRQVLLPLALLVLGACGPRPKTEGGLSVPARVKPEWHAPGFFVHFAGEALVDELHAELGGGGTHGVGPLELMLESTSFEDYQRRLSGDGPLHRKLASSKAAGAQVIYQLELMPRWLSSAPGDDSLSCPDEPLWPRWGRVLPAADKWGEWEALVEYTVAELTVRRGYDHLWFQLWEEPNAPCYWSGTEADYLELYARTAAAVKRANPGARIGGPGVFHPDGAIAPSTTPLVRALITHAAANHLPLDFVAYHVFGLSPHRARTVGRGFDAALTAAGFPETRLLISSFNPLDSTASPYWPTPPTPSPTGRTWEYDTEIGAPYVPALSQAMASVGRRGALTLFQLDDFHFGGEFESDSGWGARTPEELHGIRKAIYQGMRLQAQVPAPLLPVTVTDPAVSPDGADAPVGAIAGAADGEVAVLLWSYVSAPQAEATAIVTEAGFPEGLATWDRTALEAFVRGTGTLDAVTQVPAEQAAVEAARRVFTRQVQLVGRRPRLCLKGDGLSELRSAIVVDAAHNNAYAAFKKSGLDAALAAGVLTESADLVQRAGDCWSLQLEPYSVVGLRFAAPTAPAGLTVTVSE